MSINLESLGFTNEELRERVIDRIVDQVMDSEYEDEDGRSIRSSSSFGRALHLKVQKQIDDTVATMAEKYILPNVSAYIESLTLQETNKWGEKSGMQVTFIEYLVKRAEAYMTEQVDGDGKSKAESTASYWSAKQTRVSSLINKHLHYSIETAMKQALSDAHSKIVKGLEDTVKMKLAEISQGLKVTVMTK
jgi:hypothetical protein